MNRGPFERNEEPLFYLHGATWTDATARYPVGHPRYAQEPAGGGAGPPPDSQATPRPQRPVFEKPSRYDFGMRGHKGPGERSYDDAID